MAVYILLISLEPLDYVFLMTAVMAVLAEYERIGERAAVLVLLGCRVDLKQADRASRQAVRAVCAIRA
jgi:hypothetical protein